MSEVGELIKYHREVLNLSQSKLGKIFRHKNGQFVSNVERGVCGWPLKDAKKLTKVLYISQTIFADALVKDFMAKVEESFR